MDVISLIIRRTGMSTEDAEFYAQLAESRIRAYIGSATEDISPYTLQQCDIAILYYQKDNAAKSASSAAGFKAETFTEGNVSVSRSGGMSVAEIQTAFDESIEEVLMSIGADVGTVVFI